jgi:predicted MFS family arabinose efflux permease
MTTRSSTFRFITQEWRFLLFGLMFSFWSSPGQTFVISLFGGVLRADFGLSHGEFGTIYTIATLSSAALLWKTGPWVDYLPLKAFALRIALAMVISIFVFATIQGPITLLLGIFCVRFLGQGMMNHIAVTAIARRYEKERGRAVAIANFGFPLAESLFPPIITIALLTYDWRIIWIVLGVLAAFFLLPFISRLIVHTDHQDGAGHLTASSDNSAQSSFTRADVLKQWQFYILALLPVAQSGTITGLFFHQVHFMQVKGWSMEWWSLNFTTFALCSFLGGLTSGFLVDFFRARTVTPFALIPLGIALIILANTSNEMFIILIMGLLGYGAGFGQPALSSLWPELYGTTHLGAIRSVANVVMVFGSALGPVIMGIALDNEATLPNIFYAGAAMAFASALAAKLVLSLSLKR